MLYTVNFCAHLFYKMSNLLFVIDISEVDLYGASSSQGVVVAIFEYGTEYTEKLHLNWGGKEFTFGHTKLNRCPKVNPRRPT